jgi:hypothetical protein
MPRELIRQFEDCQWRTTRIDIVRDLARHPEQRTLEFLFELSLNASDTPRPQCASAIW